jgi:alkylated DNA repair dioxygenase AlkB
LVQPDNDGTGASIFYIPSLIEKVDADHLFHWLLKNVEWRREIDNFGPQNRLSAYFGDTGCTFSYVGLTLKPRPWPTPMLKVRQHLEAHLVKDPFLSGISCSACLVNNYPPGEGHIVWHHDEVRAHGPRPLIVSVTLSPDGERPFELRRRSAAAGSESGDADLSLSLAHGSALVMAGSAQEGWLHRLPLPGPGAPHRISLTFRSIVPGFEDAAAAAAAAACTV